MTRVSSYFILLCIGEPWDKPQRHIPSEEWPLLVYPPMEVLMIHHSKYQGWEETWHAPLCQLPPRSEGDLAGARKSDVSHGLLGGWEGRVLLPVMIKHGF